MAQTIKLPIPSIAYTLVMTIVIMIANLRGVDMFAKIQDLVAFLFGWFYDHYGTDRYV